MSAETRKIQQTAYPHIVKIEGVCGGDAIIEGTRITVASIVEFYYKSGLSIEEIAADWDALTPAQVFSALAYYHDNKAEIDRARWENSYEYQTIWLNHFK